VSTRPDEPADIALAVRGLYRRRGGPLRSATAPGAGPYVDYVRAEILEPLGMTSTDFAYRADMTRRAATGYHPRFNTSTPHPGVLSEQAIPAMQQTTARGQHHLGPPQTHPRGPPCHWVSIRIHEG
jgi:CubicO group peptidase (beta-lactamase class C family)